MYNRLGSQSVVSLVGGETFSRLGQGDVSEGLGPKPLFLALSAFWPP